MKEFFVTLLSYSSFDTFPENTRSSFQITLPQSINLERDAWLVGLAEISYPAVFELILRGLQIVKFPKKDYSSILDL